MNNIVWRLEFGVLRWVRKIQTCLKEFKRFLTHLRLNNSKLQTPNAKQP